MSDSILNSLFSMLDKRGLGEIAGAVGEPEQSVAQGMQWAIATLLTGIASKAGDSMALRQILDSASHETGDVSWSRLTAAVSEPNSPLISGGSLLLSRLFKGGEAPVVNALGRESGLRSSTASTLMSMAAALVTSFLSRRVRDEGMTMNGLGQALQQESSSFRNALPAGLRDVLRTSAPAPHTPTPVIAHPMHIPSSTSRWLAVLGLAVLIPALFWLFSEARKQNTAKTTIGEASRTATGTSPTGALVTRKLRNDVELNLPENGTEVDLLGFIEDPARPVDEVTWFSLDRLKFDTGSATPRPESREQLSNIAAILVAYPNVRLEVGGYPDNVGSAQRNLKLSQDRANVVVAELVRRGISPDRLSALSRPVGGAGHVSLLVTQK
jgi:OmpA-OmpF porin, OOP family